MTRKLLSSVLAGVCGALLISATLSAEVTNEQPRVAVGERAEPVEQKIARLTERENMLAKSTAVSKKNGKSSQMKDAEAGVSYFSSKVYYTQHPAVYQNPISVSFPGTSVELTDGSIWTIHPSDAYKTTGWFPTDVIVITPNHSLFSLYDYRLTNQNTGESAAADLHLGPIDPSYGSIYTHWITGIDYYRNIVYLEDGSIWYMSTFDRNIVDYWAVNDVVIIGVNDGWLSSSNPNILINVNMINYATGGASF